MSSLRASIAVIGAGPRAAGWLERFAANRAAAGGGEPVTIHLVDPHPAGPGRIWRSAQSPLLKLNSMAADVTMFTDVSCAIDGPIVPGPSLIEWAEQVRAGHIDDGRVTDAVVRAELEGLTGSSFPTRRLQSHYLDWFQRRAVELLDEDVTIVVHADRAVSVEGGDDVQQVTLEDGSGIRADLVLYALGHNGRALDGEPAALAAFADRHGLHYQPPAFTADADTSALAAGRPIVVRGFGLAAVDLVVLLTEGRGGRFDRAPGGGLQYTPSGLEPRILIGSRRGVPYHAKIASTLVGDRPPLRFFTADALGRLLGRGTPVDFRSEVWPLIAREMLHGYYAELFTGHPERTASDWSSFVARLALVDPFGDEYRALVERTVPHEDDRLLLDEFDRPLDAARFENAAALQEAVRDYIRRDLRLRSDQGHSATLGLFTALLQCMFVLAPESGSPGWSETARTDLRTWWPGFFSYVASGPPGHRLEELVALSEAGIVEFLGGGMRVTADEDAGAFIVGGSNVDGEFAADTLVDAWLPGADAATSDSAALRDLVARGDGAERDGLIEVRPLDSRIVRTDGSVHPRRYAIGPFTTAPFAGAFSRPGTNALSFRENDAVALAMVRRLSGAEAPAGAVEPPATRTSPAIA